MWADAVPFLLIELVALSMLVPPSSQIVPPGLTRACAASSRTMTATTTWCAARDREAHEKNAVPQLIDDRRSKEAPRRE